MAWELLPTNYTDAVWNGLKKYNQIENNDGTISLQDVTIYTNKEKSFFGALQANRMNEALNTIMSALDNGTDLYEVFQNYFNEQKRLFENKEIAEYNSLAEHTNNLKEQGNNLISTIERDYRREIESFENTQEQVFSAWFQAMKNQLSQDAAGNIQNHLTELSERLTSFESTTTRFIRFTLRPDMWVRDGAVFSCSVSNRAVKASDNPLLLPVLPSANNVVDLKAYKKNFAYLLDGTTENGSIRLRAIKKPTIDLSVVLKGA